LFRPLLTIGAEISAFVDRSATSSVKILLSRANVGQPVSLRHSFDQRLSIRRAAVAAGHVGSSSCMMQDNNVAFIHEALSRPKLPSLLGRVRLVLLGHPKAHLCTSCPFARPSDELTRAPALRSCGSAVRFFQAVRCQSRTLLAAEVVSSAVQALYSVGSRSTRLTELIPRSHRIGLKTADVLTSQRAVSCRIELPFSAFRIMRRRCAGTRVGLWRPACSRLNRRRVRSCNFVQLQRAQSIGSNAGFLQQHLSHQRTAAGSRKHKPAKVSHTAGFPTAGSSNFVRQGLHRSSAA
jgi:hypothetical protein